MHSRDQSDRISNLPIDVLYHILSFLETIDVVRTCILSTRWRFLWTSLPHLSFDERTSFASHHFNHNDSLEKFVDIIQWVLIHRDRNDIKRFRLVCDHDTPVVYSFLCHAARRNVQELDLQSCTWSSFKLPSLLVKCESLMVLKLCLNHCILEFPTSMGFSRLKTLHLVDIQFSNEDFVRELFLSLGVLEELKMEKCILRKVKVFEIASKKLKSLTFVNTGFGCTDCDGSFVGDLKVSATDLVSFCYVGPMLDSYSLQNQSSLRNVFIHLVDGKFHFQPAFLLSTMIRGIHNVEVLRVSSHLLKYISYLCGQPGRFPTALNHLKSLQMCVESNKHMEGIVYLLKYSPNLEDLCIYFEEGCRSGLPLEFPEESLTCLTNHLRKVEINNFVGDRDELQFVKFILNNGKVLEKLTIIYLNPNTNMKNSQKMLAFSKASPEVLIFFPDCEQRKPFWFDDEEEIFRYLVDMVG